jgi:hypothetical protein
MRCALALALLLLASPLAAQSCTGGTGSVGCWATWRSNNPFRNHPMAHSLGGAGMLLVARGPWFAESFHDKRWKRLTIVAVGGALWQFNNMKELPGYSKRFAGLDLATNLVSATVMDVVLEAVF